MLRQATETWVAAIAAAPLVLMYPLYLVIFGRSALTIVMMGFTAGLAPVILKTLEGLSGTRRVLINVGKSFNLTPSQQFWKILFPAALPTIFVGLRLGLIFSLINIVGGWEGRVRPEKLVALDIREGRQLDLLPRGKAVEYVYGIYARAHSTIPFTRPATNAALAACSSANMRGFAAL